MLSSRMRKASTSPSMRAPSGVAVPVRRATCPSTASRTSATVDRVTSAVVDTGRPNASATRPARLAAALAGGDNQGGPRRTGGQPGDPAGQAETGGDGHDAEQGGGGEHP